MLVGPLAWLNVPNTVPIATNSNVTMLPGMYPTLDDLLWPCSALGRSGQIHILLLLSGMGGGGGSGWVEAAVCRSEDQVFQCLQDGAHHFSRHPCSFPGTCHGACQAQG